MFVGRWNVSAISSWPRRPHNCTAAAAEAVANSTARSHLNTDPHPFLIRRQQALHCNRPILHHHHQRKTRHFERMRCLGTCHISGKICREDGIWSFQWLTLFVETFAGGYSVCLRIGSSRVSTPAWRITIVRKLPPAVAVCKAATLS